MTTVLEQFQNLREACRQLLWSIARHTFIGQVYRWLFTRKSELLAHHTETEAPGRCFCADCSTIALKQQCTEPRMQDVYHPPIVAPRCPVEWLDEDDTVEDTCTTPKALVDSIEKSGWRISEEGVTFATTPVTKGASSTMVTVKDDEEAS